MLPFKSHSKVSILPSVWELHALPSAGRYAIGLVIAEQLLVKIPETLPTECHNYAYVIACAQPLPLPLHAVLSLLWISWLLLLALQLIAAAQENGVFAEFAY